MKTLLVFLLYVQLLEGNENSEHKHRKVRSLLPLLGDIFGGNDQLPAQPNIQPPPVYVSSMTESDCQPGWTNYMGQCYLYVHDVYAQWDQAEERCQQMVPGGHLTSISSAEHNDFLVKLATYDGGQTGQFWTGGSSNQGSNSLHWTDGSVVNFLLRPVTSILHAVGGLLNSILNLRVCLKININIGGHGDWDGSDCGQKLPFMCCYKPNLIYKRQIK